MLSPLPGIHFFFTDVLKGPPLPFYSMPRAEPSAGDTRMIKETAIPLLRGTGLREREAHCADSAVLTHPFSSPWAFPPHLVASTITPDARLCPSQQSLSGHALWPTERGVRMWILSAGSVLSWLHQGERCVTLHKSLKPLCLNP